MIEINSEGGYIGPICWRNKSPEFSWNIQLPDEGEPWNHKFYIEGSFSLSPMALTKIKRTDITLTEVSCQGEKLMIDRAPKALLNVIKTTVLNALEVQVEIIREDQVAYLNTCLNKA
jgi:hypothetical protein